MTASRGKRSRSRNLVLPVVPLGVARLYFSLICLVPIVLWMYQCGDIPDGLLLVASALLGALVTAARLGLLPARAIESHTT